MSLSTRVLPDATQYLDEDEIRRGLRLSLADPTEGDDWELLLRGTADAGFFHSRAWTTVLKDVFGFKPFYFVVQDASNHYGLLPVMEVQGAIKGRRGVCLPFTDICPAIASDPSLIQPLVKAAHRLGKSYGWNSLEIRGQTKDQREKERSVSFYSHIIELPANPELAHAGFKSEVRTAIRKAIDSGVCVSVEQSLDAIHDFYRLYLLTRRKQGLPPQAFRFFEAIYSAVLAKGAGAVVVARHQGKPVGAGVFFSWGHKTIFKYGASDPAQLRLRANDLVMWEAIQWCIAQGARTLHLGRASLNNPGLRRFKLGWGAQEQVVDYCRRSCRNGKILRMTDRAKGWHNRFFRMLPVSVSRFMGAALYRYAA